MNQTVTFADGQSDAGLTVPIITGAPNPGEVDVNLTITPINPPPNLSVRGPLDLSVLASDTSIPPMIVASDGTPQGIELIFSKPMDPLQASKRAAGRKNAGAGAAHGLVDLEGDPIDQTTTPGRFRFNVGRGYSQVFEGL